MIYLDDTFTLDGIAHGGEETCLWLDRLGLLFDIGRCPDQAIPNGTLLLSHPHLDHAAGIPYYIGRRALMGLPPCSIYVPQECFDSFSSILTIWQELDRAQYRFRFIPVETDKRYEIGKRFFFKAYPVEHRGTPSLGYTIFEEKSKLKAEYLGLPDEKIVALRKENADIFSLLQTPRMSYLGDCIFSSFEGNPVFRNSQYLILECTFLDSRRDAQHASRWGHIHIDQIAAHPECFEKIEKIVLVHFSRRYHKEYIRDKIRQKCDAPLFEKILLL